MKRNFIKSLVFLVFQLGPFSAYAANPVQANDWYDLYPGDFKISTIYMVRADNSAVLRFVYANNPTSTWTDYCYLSLSEQSEKTILAMALTAKSNNSVVGFAYQKPTTTYHPGRYYPKLGFTALPCEDLVIK